MKREVSQDGPLATFHANVDRRGDGECWPWKRPPCKAGYGQIQWLDGKVWYAHRVAYLLAYGEVPVSDDPDDPIEIDHLCHTLACVAKPCPHRLCCNPAHLEAKPRSANTGRTTFWMRCPEGCTCSKHVTGGNWSSAGHGCAEDCTCGRHDRRGVTCPPGCTCGKHTHGGWRKPVPNAQPALF